MLNFYDVAFGLMGNSLQPVVRLMYLIPVSTPGNEADTAMHPKGCRIGGQ